MASASDDKAAGKSVGIYFAGSWKDRESIRRCMEAAVAMGVYYVTHDWTTYETQYTDRHERSKLCAGKDIEGVLRARIVVLMLTDPDPKYPYRGTSSELGAALACRKIREGCDEPSPRIWIVAPKDPRRTSEAELPYCLTTCFFHMADEYFASPDDMLRALRERAHGG